MTMYLITEEQRTSVEALSMQLLDSQHANDHKAAQAVNWAKTLQPALHVGTVYTMEALVPGGEVRHHVTLHCGAPAGTALLAKPAEA